MPPSLLGGALAQEIEIYLPIFEFLTKYKHRLLHRPEVISLGMVVCVYFEYSILLT